MKRDGMMKMVIVLILIALFCLAAALILSKEKCADEYRDGSIGTYTTTTVHIKPPGRFKRGSDDGFGFKPWRGPGTPGHPIQFH